MRGVTAMVLAGLGCALFGCGGSPSPIDPGDPAGEGIRIEEVVPIARFPVAIAFAPDGRAFYTEKDTGLVRVLTPEGQLLAAPFADVPVASSGERGLLGIALHPQFDENGYVYVFYTRSATGEDTRDFGAALDNRVVRFTAIGNVGVEETLIFEMPATPGPNHNGGNIHFGPDGKLYVTLGDLNDVNNAQAINVLPGRILRLNDDGTIPADNPFGPQNPTFALGLRNSFDFTFDPVTGGLFATENGTFLHDEVNLLPPGSNGGWPLVEGPAGDQTINVDFGFYVDPLVASDGSVAPTGIDFAPDATFGPESQHALFVGEFLTGRVIRYTLNAARDAVVAEDIFARSITGGITDVTFAPDGTLYVLTSTSILRIVPE